MKNLGLMLLLGLLLGTAYAQKNVHRDSILLSGIVFDADSSRPLSNVNVTMHNTRGTVSDRNGYFEIHAGAGDTILFKYVGFKDSRLIIPEKVSNDEYYSSIGLSRSVITLKEIEIFPWPKEAFKQALLNTPVHDKNLENAQRNLNISTYAALSNPQTAWTRDEIQKYYMNQFAYKVTNKDRQNALQSGVITPATSVLNTNTVIGLILLARQLHREELKKHDYQDFKDSKNEKKE